MPGICCCDAWQDWTRWDAEHFLIAEESVRSQVKRLRIHPSILVFLYVFLPLSHLSLSHHISLSIMFLHTCSRHNLTAFRASSDLLPPESVEQMYLSVFSEEYWPNPIVSSLRPTPFSSFFFFFLLFSSSFFFF